MTRATMVVLIVAALALVYFWATSVTPEDSPADTSDQTDQNQ